MSGDRAARLARVVGRAGAKMQRMVLAVQDRYASPDMMTGPEMERHKRDFGHYYDDACTEPHCEKWRGMVEGAMTQMRNGA